MSHEGQRARGRHWYVHAVVFQALAPLSLLLFSLVVAKQIGVSSQGAFASVKSWVDVLIVAGCFGFPQSSILAINKEGSSAKWMYRAAGVYVATLVPLFALASMGLQAKVATHATLAISIGFGAAAAVLANIWRGILLTVEDGLRFHLITILPTFSLILVSSIGLVAGYSIEEHIGHFYGATALIVFPIAYYLFPWRMVAGAQGGKPSLARLLMNGSDVFVQALSGVLQTYICLWFLRHSYDLTQVGYFSLCLLLVNAFGFPLQAVSPMILNRWSKSSGRQSLWAGNRELNLFLLGLLVMLTCVSILLSIFPFENYLSRAGDLVAPMGVAIFILIPNISLRVDSLRLASVGDLRFNSIIALSKCGFFSLLLAAIVHGADPRDGVRIAMFCWLLAEIGAAVASRIRVCNLRTEIE